jgi:hypothetical protein
MLTMPARLAYELHTIKRHRFFRQKYITSTNNMTVTVSELTPGESIDECYCEAGFWLPRLANTSEQTQTQTQTEAKASAHRRNGTATGGVRVHG